MGASDVRSIFKRERRETCELVYLCVVCYCARSGTPATIVFVLLLSFKTARSMRLCLVMMQTSDYRFVSSSIKLMEKKRGGK